MDAIDTSLNEFGSPRSHQIGQPGPEILLEREDETGVADHFGQTRLITRHDRGTELHGLDHRSAEPFVLTREREGVGHTDETIAVGIGDPAHVHDRAGHPLIGQLTAHCFIDRTSPSHEDEPNPEM